MLYITNMSIKYCMNGGRRATGRLPFHAEYFLFRGAIVRTVLCHVSAFSSVSCLSLRRGSAGIPCMYDVVTSPTDLPLNYSALLA